MIDIDDPDALPELRRFIASVGLDPSGLTDEEVRVRVRALLEERVPAPAVGSGDRPINGREWFAAALTASGFRQPEDRGRRAVVDVGEPVHLVVLGILVMRHLPNVRPPQPWTDESLAAQSGQPVEDFARAQRLLDEVAADVSVPPRLGSRWWEQERGTSQPRPRNQAQAMADPDPHFLEGANPVLGAAVVPRAQPELPMLVLVVDDSADDELVSVLAAANMVPAHGYGGAWAAQITPGVLTIKFTLVRLGGGWERAWTFPNAPDELLGPIIGGAHHVAILPREFAGDLSKLDPVTLGGSIIIEAVASEAVAAARAARDELAG